MVLVSIDGVCWDSIAYAAPAPLSFRNHCRNLQTVSMILLGVCMCRWARNKLGCWQVAPEAKMKQQRTRRFMSDYCESMRAKLETEARHPTVWMHASCCSSDASFAADHAPEPI